MAGLRIHPGYNINEISKLNKIGIQYYVHNENGFGYWFPEVQPHIINNKYENAQVLEKIFTNLYADFIKKPKQLQVSIIKYMKVDYFIQKDMTHQII